DLIWFPDPHEQQWRLRTCLMQLSQLRDYVALSVSHIGVADGIFQAQHGGGDTETDEGTDPARVIGGRARGVERRPERHCQRLPVALAAERLRHPVEQRLVLPSREVSEVPHLRTITDDHAVLVTSR